MNKTFKMTFSLNNSVRIFSNETENAINIKMHINTYVNLTDITERPIINITHLLANICFYQISQ